MTTFLLAVGALGLLTHRIQNGGDDALLLLDL
jgi:hypothetical protein